jgi:dTDP-4-dehydrorhamnose 3,5-epimerase-like enzyme
MSKSNIAQLEMTRLKSFSSATGSLVVVEKNKDVHFGIARVFVVKALRGETRGKHAHKECQQFLFCTNGRIEVICDDGTEKRTFLLDDSDKALLIPAGIWAHQNYLEENSVLTVLCDLLYDENDYLRNYEDFKKFRGLI